MNNQDLWAYSGNVLVQIVGVGFICYNLKSKLNKVLTFFLIIIPISAVMLLRLYDYEKYMLIIAYAPYAVCIACAFLLFSSPLKEKVLVSILYFIVQLFIALLVGVISDKMGIYDLLGKEVFYYLIGVTVLFLISYTIVSIVINKKIRKQKSHFFLGTYFYFIVSQIILLFVSIISLKVDRVFEYERTIKLLGSNKNIVFYLIIFSIVFSVIADVILFFVMARNARNAQLQEDLRFMEYQAQQSLEYYQSLQHDATETRKIRHDLNNVLQIAYSMFHGNMPEDKEQSEILLAELEESINGMRVEEYSQNQLVNVIIANKVKQ